MSKSARYSFLLAAAYCSVATIYIVYSGRVAAQFAASVEDLRRIEELKGIVYVAVTTLAVFCGGYLAMRRMDRDADELVRRERALVASEGRVLAGLMAASVAHDANNVLQTVLGNLSMLTPGDPQDPESEVLGELREGVARLVGLNQRLVSGARSADHGEEREVGLLQVVRDTLASMRAHAHVRGRHVHVRGDAAVVVKTKPLLLQQVITNLLLNACEAARDGGTVDLVVAAQGDEALLEVHDNGPGVPLERRRGLFDALVSTKPGGAGLGLFSVRACTRALGGEVEVEASPLGGALFRARLPRQQLAAIGS